MHLICPPFRQRRLQNTSLLKKAFFNQSLQQKAITPLNQAKCFHRQLYEIRQESIEKSNWIQTDIQLINIQGLQRPVLLKEPTSRHQSLPLDPITEALYTLTFCFLTYRPLLLRLKGLQLIIFPPRHLALFIYIIQLLNPFLKFQWKKQAE